MMKRISGYVYCTSHGYVHIRTMDPYGEGEGGDTCETRYWFAIYYDDHEEAPTRRKKARR